MAKKTSNKNEKKEQQQQSPSKVAPAKESGKIRQRVEEVDQTIDDDHHHNAQVQHQQEVPTAPVSHPTDNVNVLLLNLNSNPEHIYRQTLGKMLASTLPQQMKNNNNNSNNNKKTEEPAKSAQKNNATTTTTTHHQHNNEFYLSSQKASFFVEDQQSATILIKFGDKYAAKKFAQKLNHSQLFGASSASTASVVATSSLMPKYEPCALRITELLANGSNNSSLAPTNSAGYLFSLQQLQQYLGSNPGFLSVSRVATTTTTAPNDQQKKQQNNNNNINNNNRCFIATYADSGAALQARALMSGRAFHGVHLLFERIEEESEQIVPLV